MRRKTVRFSAVLSIFLPILAVEAQDVDVSGNLTMRDSTVPAYVWTQILIPSATVIQAFGLNDEVQVAVTTSDGRNGIYREGTFTPLPAPPPGFQVGALGINNDGVVTGIATTNANPHQQGFILHESTYTFFSRAGWDNTQPRAIANSGLITGYSFNNDGRSAGFIYDPDTDTFTDATPPGSINTITQGMNRFGRITGHGQDTVIGRYGFVWQQRTITNSERELVPFLDRFLVADGGTAARGINDSGLIVGNTIAGGIPVGFVGNSSRGYQLLIPPSAGADTFTFCPAINNAAQVVCGVGDDAGNVDFFIGSPSDDGGP